MDKALIALKAEAAIRMNYFGDIDSAVHQCGHMITQVNSYRMKQAGKRGLYPTLLDPRDAAMAALKRIERFYGLQNKYNADGSLKNAKA